MPVTTAAISLVDALFAASVRNAVLSDSFAPHLRREVLWLAGGYVLDVWIEFNEWKYLIAQRRFEIGITSFDKTNEKAQTYVGYSIESFHKCIQLTQHIHLKIA
jgi:hypothetical protein